MQNDEPEYHRLLKRQLKKHFGGSPIPENLHGLLHLISSSYTFFDKDQELLERSMDISSEELIKKNNQLKAEIERKNIAEAKRVENEQLLNAINANIDEAIYRSLPDGTIIYANEAFIKLFGYKSFDEIKNHRFPEFYQDMNKRDEMVSKQFLNGHVKGEEVQFKKQNGIIFWGYTSSMLSKDSNGVKVCDGAITDITAIKEYEQQLMEKNDELKKINSELDRFVYSASHDLIAPLKSLLGLIQLMKMEYINDGHIQQHMTHMETSIKRLDKLIRDIIDYSRNARLEHMVELIDFNKITYEAFENHQYIKEASMIKLSVDIDNNISYKGDPRRIKIIFNNLICNAIKYQNSNISDPYIFVKIERNGNGVAILIEDNGIGIKKEHLDNVFKMFYRASEKSSGSGLGLYIVKEAVDYLNGNISVESEYGIGSKFNIYLSG